MIYFISADEDGHKIEFGSTEEADVVLSIVDDYSGLVTYREKMKVSPGYKYYFLHNQPVCTRRFMVSDVRTNNILLNVNTMNPNSPKIEDVDPLGLLKSLKYDSGIDSQPGIALYEIFTTKIYDKYIQIEPNDIVFDIGANIGLFSYYAVCKGAKEVHAFEPSPEIAEVITNNFRFDNLRLIQSAVCDKDGEIEFNINPESSINSSIQAIGNESYQVKLPALKLSTYIKQNSIEKIDYLKIDCEGSEYDIIQDIPTSFLTNNVKKIALEYHQNTNGKLQKLIDKLKECGFSIRFEFSPNQINDELGMLYAAKSVI